MPGLREWIEERRTEGIGATASLLLVIGALAGLGVVLAKSAGEMGPGKSGDGRVASTEFGAAAGATTVVDGEGRQLSLSAFRGKVVLVDVWATWCAPCRQSLPEIAALQAESRQAGAGFAVVPISVDDGGAPEVRRFLDAHPELGMTSYFPAAGRLSIAPLGKIQGIPASFILDREGRVIERWAGFTPGRAAQALKGAVAR